MRARTFAALAIALGCAGCVVGPDYHRPSAPVLVAYKGLKGWQVAAPRAAEGGTG